MKPPPSPSALPLVLAASLLPIASGHATESTHPGSPHLCLLFDDPGAEVTRPASKPAADLNVGDARTVRMIYFLPANRTFREEVAQRIRDQIRNTQAFYEEQMEAHGYGYRTFRYETDDEGLPLVHRVDGRHPDDHYFRNSSAMRSEIAEIYDLHQNVYLVIFDNAQDGIAPGPVLGTGSPNGKSGGLALVSEEFTLPIAAHELAHAFGLTWHDFRDGDYILSYGPGWNRLSACHAGFIAVHPYFDPQVGRKSGPWPRVELLSPPTYPPGSKSHPLQFHVTAAPGVHHASLLVDPLGIYIVSAGADLARARELKACLDFGGEREVRANFEYDGVLPSKPSTSLRFPEHTVHLAVVDRDCNRSDFSTRLFHRPPQYISALDGYLAASGPRKRRSVRSVSFAPDNSTVASGQASGTLTLWDSGTGSTLATLQDSGSTVASVSFSPDGTVLASGGPDGIKLWNVESGANTVTFPSYPSFRSLAFSPDGTVLATGDNLGIHLWDIPTKKLVRTLSRSWITKVAFSPRGILASATSDGEVELWDTDAGTAIASLEGQEGAILDLAFSADGSTLATSVEGGIRLWDVGTGESSLIPDPDGPVLPDRFFAFSPVGSILAAGTAASVVIWDLPTRKKLHTLEGHSSRVNSLSFSVDGSVLASGGSDARVILWDVSEWTNPRPVTLWKISGDDQTGGAGGTLTDPFVVEVRDQADHPLQGARVTFSIRSGHGKLSNRFAAEQATTDADGRAEARLTLGPIPGPTTIEVSVPGVESVTFHSVATGTPIPPAGDDHRTWNLPQAAISRLGKGHLTQARYALAFSPHALAVGSNLGVWLYDSRTFVPLAWLRTPVDDSTFLSFSPDGTLLAMARSGGADQIRLWNIPADYVYTTLHSEGLSSPAVFSPTEATIAVGLRDGAIEILDRESGQVLTTLEGHDGAVHSLSFSPDGSMLVSGSQDRTMRLWDLKTRTTMGVLGGHDDGVTTVALSPDGAAIVSASGYRLQVWDPETGTNLAVLEALAYGAGTFSLSPDGTLASVSSEAIRIWDLERLAHTSTFLGHRYQITSLSFSRDGTTLASGSWLDGTVRLWDAATGSTLARIVYPRQIERLALSPDGTLLATASNDFAVTLWDISTGSVVGRMGHPYLIESVAFSPDGTLLASGMPAYISDRFYLWDVGTGANTAILEEAPDWLDSPSLSPDGSLRAAIRGYQVHLRDVATETRKASLVGHGGLVLGAAFSPDGATIASASADRTIKLWEVATGRHISTLRGHAGAVTGVLFLPDGTLVSGSRDGTVLFWDRDLAPAPRPETLTQVSGDEQLELPSVALREPFVVEVRDENGDPFEGAQVTFRVTGGGGTMSTETATTDAQGRAASTLTLGNTPGPNSVEVTVAGLEPLTFTATGRTVPTTLMKVAGDGQHGTVGAPLQNPLVVSVLDQTGAPLPGAVVIFRVTDGKGKVSERHVATDDRGRAATSLTLGPEPGTNTVRVTVPGLDPMTFTATGIGIPHAISKVSGDGQEGWGGSQLQEPLVVSVLDRTGSALYGAVVTFTVTDGEGVLSVTTDTTDVRGHASTTLTLGRQQGTSTVEVTVGELEPVTFTATARTTPDFDGDGVVGLSDFFLFAGAFGGSDPRFDLDDSGHVDFTDFFLFAEHFGQPARAKLLALARDRIDLPDGPRLQQNTPNPFNSQTVIPWFLLQRGPARVEVYALTGQRVAVLHQGQMEAGFHRLHWDGRDDQGRLLASGVYVCRLVTSEVAQTRKLTLVR